MKIYFIVNTRHLITLIIMVGHPEIRSVTVEAGVLPWSLRLSCFSEFYPAISRDTVARGRGTPSDEHSPPTSSSQMIYI